MQRMIIYTTGAMLAITVTASTALADCNWNVDGAAMGEHPDMTFVALDPTGGLTGIDELTTLDVLANVASVTDTPQDTQIGVGESLGFGAIVANLGLTDEALTPQEALEGIGAAFVQQASTIDIKTDTSILQESINIASIGSPQPDQAVEGTDIGQTQDVTAAATGLAIDPSTGQPDSVVDLLIVVSEIAPDIATDATSGALALEVEEIASAEMSTVQSGPAIEELDDALGSVHLV